VLLATFGLVIFRDLTEGILIGFALSGIVFLHRMADAVEVDKPHVLQHEDTADAVNGNGRKPYDAAVATDPDVVVYRISGAFFFGAAAAVAAALERIGEHPKAYVIDFSAVPVLDSTAAATIAGFVRKARRHGAIVYIAGARPAIRRILLIHGVRRPQVRFKTALADALASAHDRSAGAQTTTPT
jgi:SulP family sulfate permease